jgi:signal transduction histidine kinase/DNA-binding response OmpR family regulator
MAKMVNLAIVAQTVIGEPGKMKRHKTKYRLMGGVFKAGFQLLLWGILSGIGIFAYGQGTTPLSGMPQLQPSYLNHFAEDKLAYANTCFSDVWLDQEGKLWLNVCGVDRLLNSMGLYRFDGYHFQPVAINWQGDHDAGGFIIAGIDPNGNLYTTIWDKLFFLDLKARIPKLIPPADTSYGDMKLSGFQMVDSTVYMMGHRDDPYIHLLRVENDRLIEEQSFDYAGGAWGLKSYPMRIDEDEYWLMGATLPLCRYDRKAGQLRQYRLKDFDYSGVLQLPDSKRFGSKYPVLLKKGTDSLYLYLPQYYGHWFFEYDRQRDRFVSMREQFPADWTPAHLFEDQSGNTCFLFKDGKGQYRAILEDTNGQRYDYSAVVRSISNIRKLVATDFRQQVYAVGQDGLYSIGIRAKESIQQLMPGHWVSAMAELPDGRILVSDIRSGWYTYDEQNGQSLPFEGPDCGVEPHIFAKGMKQQLIRDDSGNIWMSGHGYLLRYDPNTNTCEAFKVGGASLLFCLLQNDLVAVQTGNSKIGFYNLRTRQMIDPGDAVPQDVGGFIRDMFMDAKGKLWVPTNKGLWQIDLAGNKSRHYTVEDGFADDRFTTVYEDDKGRLWLGTYYGGLQLFDPQTGAISIIDQEQGLSNNAVEMIIPDETGTLWVATAHGLNIVSKEGEVLHNIFEEDGLIDDAFERFDPLKTADGRLFFGTRKGVSMVDPSKLKATSSTKRKPQIYLTELTYFDKKQGKDTTLKEGFQELPTIQIRAEQADIHLKFALSSYLEPRQNRYAYKLQGKEEDWRYLGYQPELHIGRLPPGKYNLLVKGADFRNNWTSTPIVIPIHTREFFYKTAWFYLLLSLPVGLLVLMWARNKNRKAQQLEEEVERRTQKIMEDKEVIAQQARELQQLDELKTRFFTNISHELRTPITLIRTPLEKLLQQYSRTIERSFADSLQLIFRNAKKLGELVEELLELSRLDANKASLTTSPTELSPFLRQLFGAYASAADMKGIDYTFRSGLADETAFLIDRNHLGKVINNLLSNALKFTPAGGQVSLSLQRSGQQLIVEVQDTGKGIPPEDLPHVFDRFFQSKRKDHITSEGIGIGLALSHELALLMKGSLSVVSEVGQGSTFCLKLPARPAALSHPHPQPQAAGIREPSPMAKLNPHTPPGAKHTHSKKSKLLIVEDNLDMQQLLRSLLQDDYHCELASNGAKAWQMLEAHDEKIRDIDLIVSDVMMPEMDGYTLLEKIKAHPHWQKIPVIMLTARAAEEDKLKALRMGVDDYLLKPFSPAELSARTYNLIANYQARSATPAEHSAADDKSGTATEAMPSSDLTWLETVEKLTKAALDEQLKLNTSYLAKQTFMSERQFSRKLKATTGLTPSGYIQEAKLSKARHLLENKACNTVGEVAAACGYSSGSYLAKVFQERFGKLPGDYLP